MCDSGNMRTAQHNTTQPGSRIILTLRMPRTISVIITKQGSPDPHSSSRCSHPHTTASGVAVPPVRVDHRACQNQSAALRNSRFTAAPSCQDPLLNSAGAAEQECIASADLSVYISNRLAARGQVKRRQCSTHHHTHVTPANITISRRNIVCA